MIVRSTSIQFVLIWMDAFSMSPEKSMASKWKFPVENTLNQIKRICSNKSFWEDSYVITKILPNWMKISSSLSMKNNYKRLNWFITKSNWLKFDEWINGESKENRMNKKTKSIEMKFIYRWKINTTKILTMKTFTINFQYRTISESNSKILNMRIKWLIDYKL